MRIMQIVSGCDVSGAARHCLLLARELAGRDHEITLVCRPGAWIGEQGRSEGFEILRSDLRRWPLDELRRVADFARERGVELIHTHMSRAHAFGVLLRWMTGIPCAATAQTRRIQLHWMFNDLVFAVSEQTRRFQETYNLVPPQRVMTIHDSIDDGQAVGIERALARVVDRRSRAA